MRPARGIRAAQAGGSTQDAESDAADDRTTGSRRCTLSRGSGRAEQALVASLLYETGKFRKCAMVYGTREF